MEVAPYLLKTINQLFDMEKKCAQRTDLQAFTRHIDRIKNTLADEANLAWHNPIGEKYNETRTDCEASIVGDSIKNLVITDVIKPIIFQKMNQMNWVVQKGVVIVQSK
jgi:hypothetical protein